MPGTRLSIVVSGMIASIPRQGGATWAVLQYVLGLRRLGHAVCFVEPVCDPAMGPPGSTLRGSYNAAYFREVVRQFGLEGTSGLLRPGTRETVGLPYDRLVEIARDADLLLNVSGILTEAALLEPIPSRVYLDLDPGFTQLWHAVQGIDMGFRGHTHFVTIGVAIGSNGCDVPDCGLAWIGTAQPVVLSEWPAVNTRPFHGLTTVGNWRGYGSIEYEGRLYGQKAHSLRQLMSLPGRTPEKFILALAIHPNEKRDLDALTANGWHIVDPALLAASPDAYRRFVQASKVEFGLAKSGYVAARAGWFSDRSACYLASGRPVIAQDTGFPDFLPVGEGLLAFETAQDVLAAIEEINRNYRFHAQAARRIAEEHFDSDKVLSRLLDRIEEAPCQMP
ncbi:MAG: hypothetical protein GEU28_03005 [Dehalococcoidia bacterium]|nr:hypothetical protein [Dehalococcoidia bacterium]